MEYKDYVIEVEQDVWAESPREFDNVGMLVLSHKRYDLPNEIHFNFSECDSWDEVEKELRKVYPVVIPVFMYDHSGINFSLGGYNPYWVHASWDAGKVGYMVVDRDELAELGIKYLSKHNKEKLNRVLEGEIEQYNQYVGGDVWCVEIKQDDELIDYQGGIFGYDEAVQSAMGEIDRY